MMMGVEDNWMWDYEVGMMRVWRLCGVGMMGGGGADDDGVWR